MSHQTEESYQSGLVLQDAHTVQVEQCWQLKRIADALEEIAKFVDCSSANWGRGF